MKDRSTRYKVQSTTVLVSCSKKKFLGSKRKRTTICTVLSSKPGVRQVRAILECGCTRQEELVSYLQYNTEYVRSSSGCLLSGDTKYLTTVVNY